MTLCYRLLFTFVFSIILCGCGYNSNSASYEEPQIESAPSDTPLIRPLNYAETDSEFLIHLTPESISSFESATYSVMGSINGQYCPLFLDYAVVPDEYNILHIPKKPDILTMHINGSSQSLIIPYVYMQPSSDSDISWKTHSISLCTTELERYDMDIVFSENPESRYLNYHIFPATSPFDNPLKKEVVHEYWNTLFIYHSYYQDIFSDLGNVLPFSKWRPSLFSGSFHTCSDITNNVAFQKTNITELDEAFYCFITLKFTDNSISTSNMLTLQKGADLSYETIDIEHAEEVAINTENGKMLFAVYKDHAALTKYSGADTHLIIPDALNNVPVTTISLSAVSNNNTLKHVKFPSSLKRIDSYAFPGTSLNNFVLRENLEYIGYEAFGDSMLLDSSIDESKSIETLCIGKNVKWIGDKAFDGYCIKNFSVSAENPYYASLDGCIYTKDLSYFLACPTGKNGIFQIPEGVKSVSSFAFSNNGAFSEKFPDCSGITAITLSDTVEAFSCQYLPENIEKLSIGKQLSTWASVSHCSMLSEISISTENPFYCLDNGAIYDKNKTSLLCYTNITDDVEYTLPETLICIDDNAFSNVTSLQTIHVPSQCTLSDMDPDAIARQLCKIPSLTHINVEQTNTTFSSVDGVLLSSDGSILICYPSGRSDNDYKIPGTVSVISSYAFRGNKFIEDLYLPSSLYALTISDSTDNCLLWMVNLKNLHIPENNPFFLSDGSFLVSKHDNALIFSTGHYAKTIVSVPDETLSISDGIFDSSIADSITELHIPDGVISIGPNNFNEIDRSDQWDILDIFLPDTLTEISDLSFQNSEGIVIHADKDSAAAAFARQHGITLQ